MVENFLIVNWQLILFVITLIFNAGVMFSTIKNKPSELRVHKIIDEKLANKIKTLENNSAQSRIYREQLAANLQKENEYVHLSLQRIELNLKRVCDKLEIEYL